MVATRSMASAQLHTGLSILTAPAKTPPITPILRRRKCFSHNPRPQPLLQQSNHESPATTTAAALVSRRDVMSLGSLFVFGSFDRVLESGSSEAEASEACEFTETASGLAFCDRTVGTGPEAAKGQLIKAHYVGKLENGKVFESSYDGGRPLTFRLGVGEVIKGWDQGILGGEGVPPMLAGGKRTLRLPPELGYGVRGAGCRGVIKDATTCIIPPDSVLLFDVEFIGKA